MMKRGRPTVAQARLNRAMLNLFKAVEIVVKRKVLVAKS